MAKKELSVQEIMAQVDAGQLAPVYFLMGEEPYYIDLLTDYMLKHILSEDEQEFDQMVFYGKDFERGADEIFATARRYPMLGSHQVIAIKEAQLIRGLEEALSVYFQHPTPTTVLIINYKGKTIDKRKKLAGELAKSAVLFESKKVYDNKIPEWITAYAAQLGHSIEEKAALMLTEFLGNDLGRIVGEIGKLQTLLPAGAKIDAASVEKHIGISKDYNNFELIDALEVKDIAKAQKIAYYYARNPKNHPMQLTTVVMFDFFSKLMIYLYLVDKSPSSAAAELGVSPYMVRHYSTAARYYTARQVMENISLIREYDAKSKGFAQVATEDGELLRELLARLA